MNEFRRSSLALKSYRTPATAPHVTVMQNIAGEQKIGMIGEGSAQGGRPALPDRDREQEDGPEEDDHGVPLRID